MCFSHKFWFRVKALSFEVLFLLSDSGHDRLLGIIMSICGDRHVCGHAHTYVPQKRINVVHHGLKSAKPPPRHIELTILANRKKIARRILVRHKRCFNW